MLFHHMLLTLMPSVMSGKAAAQHAPDTLEAARLAEASEADVQALIGRQHPLPLQAERARLLREVRGNPLCCRYHMRMLHDPTGMAFGCNML